jgi:hypothetical protein
MPIYSSSNEVYSIRAYNSKTANIQAVQYIQKYWSFGLWPLSGIIKAQNKAIFRILELFLSSGEGWQTPTLLG